MMLHVHDNLIFFFFNKNDNCVGNSFVLLYKKWDLTTRKKICFYSLIVNRSFIFNLSYYVVPNLILFRVQSNWFPELLFITDQSLGAICHGILIQQKRLHHMGDDWIGQCQGGQKWRFIWKIETKLDTKNDGHR